MRDQLHDLLGQEQFVFTEQTCDRAVAVKQFDDLLADLGVVAAQHGRAAGLQIVDILIAVNIPEVCIFDLLHRDGERIVDRQVVLYGTGDAGTCFVRQFLGLLALLIKKLLILFKRIRSHMDTRCIPQFISLGLDRVYIEPFFFLNHFHRPPLPGMARPTTSEFSIYFILHI